MADKVTDGFFDNNVVNGSCDEEEPAFAMAHRLLSTNDDEVEVIDIASESDEEDGVPTLR